MKKIIKKLNIIAGTPEFKSDHIFDMSLEMSCNQSQNGPEHVYSMNLNELLNMGKSLI